MAGRASGKSRHQRTPTLASSTGAQTAMAPGPEGWVITRFRVITQPSADVHAGRTLFAEAGAVAEERSEDAQMRY